MDQQSACTVENFINNWNGEFPNCPLTAADLKKPNAVMSAVYQVFDRLGIDRDAVLSPPPSEERNENMVYYWDLLPVINMTRVIKHLVSVMPQVNATISIIHFLQPTAASSHSILLLSFNLMVFNEERLQEIALHEEGLFAMTDQVKALEEKKHKLLVMLNEQAKEKGERAEKMDKLEPDIKQYEEELKREKDAYDDEKQEQVESILKENRQRDIILEQKKSHRDAVMAEVARRRALRVYDVDDIKAKAEQAAQNVQEADEKLESLKATLMEKENSLKNLQCIKPNLDTANNLLNEIENLSDALRDLDGGDLESDSKDGELQVLNTELNELEAQVNELRAIRADTASKRLESQAKRRQETIVAHSAVREAQEKDKKLRERSKKAIQRTEEIKEATAQYEAQKTIDFEALASIKSNFCADLKAIDELLLKKAIDAEKKIEEKLRNKNI